MNRQVGCKASPQGGFEVKCYQDARLVHTEVVDTLLQSWERMEGFLQGESLQLMLGSES